MGRAAEILQLNQFSNTLFLLLLMKKWYISGFLLLSVFFALPAHAQQRYYVNPDALGANNGASWADAFTNLHHALAAAQSGDEVWVREGVYKPSDTGNRSARFVMLSGVRLYGGFAGSEMLPEERQTGQHPTILCGDIGVPGDSTDNSYQLLYVFQPDTNTLIDGLVFREAVANNPAAQNFQPGASGAGLMFWAGAGSAFGRVQNCVFARNTATRNGAAFFAGGEPTVQSVAPQVWDCLFTDNHSVNGSGGAWFKRGGSWLERPDDVRGCVFERNVADRGGAMFFDDSERSDTLQVRGCRFDANRAYNYTDALAIGRLKTSSDTAYTHVRVEDCVFENHVGNGVIQKDIAQPAGNLDIMIDNIALNENLSSFSFGGLVFIETIGRTISSFSNINIRNSMGTILSNGYYSKISKINAFYFKNYKGQFDFNSNSSIYASNIAIINGKTRMELHILNNPNGFVQVSNILFVNKDSVPLENFVFFKCHMRNSYFNGNLSFRKPIYMSGYLCLENCAFTGMTFTPAEISQYNCAWQNITYDVDPMFRDTAAGDFRLLPCSPLIDAGNTALLPPGLSTDLAGNPRVAGPSVDIGPYEHAGPVLLAAPTVKPDCAGLGNGRVQFEWDGACPPYTLSWAGGMAQGSDYPQTVSDLPAGDYQFTLTDARGYALSLPPLSVPLAADVPQISAVQTAPLICGQTSGGAASVIASGGLQPYTYAWSHGDDQALADALPVGSYSVTLTDAQGCTALGDAQIALQGSLAIEAQTMPVRCHNEQNGAALIVPLDGLAPHTFVWDTGLASAQLADAGPGVYGVTVTDAFGCTASTSVVLDNPPPIAVEAQVAPSNVDLPQPNGAITLTAVTGGAPQYAFNWSNGSVLPNQSGLAPGLYTLTLTDSRGCTFVKSWTVDAVSPAHEPGALSLICYPNPAKDRLYLSGEWPPALHSAQISDLAGRVWHTHAAAALGDGIALEGLSAGWYLLTLFDASGEALSAPMAFLVLE